MSMLEPVKVIIIQNNKECAKAMANLLMHEMPSLHENEIKILPDDLITDVKSILDFIKNGSSIRVIVLDVNLKLSSEQSLSHHGLRIYGEMILNEIYHIRIITISFERVERLASNTEYEFLFGSEWLTWNPHVRLPVFVKHFRSVIKNLPIMEG
jgi:hypothetical protein